MNTAKSFGIGLQTFGKGDAMKIIVIAALCITGTIGIACDTEPTPSASAGIDGGTVNTNTVTATSTATGTGGGVSATGGSVAIGTGGATGNGGSAVVGTGGTSASTCPTCTNTGTNINITVVISGASGATSTGGAVGTGGTTVVIGTGGAVGTGGTTVAPTKVCVPGQSIPCTTVTGSGSQMCSNDGMSYGECKALATGTGGSSGTGGTVAGNGACDANHVGTTFNGMVCMKQTTNVYQWVSIGTGGTTGFGGATGTGGATSGTGGTSATGGATGSGGDINASMTCDPVGTNMSFAFVRNWAGRPVNNTSATTAKFCFSPSYLIRTSDGEIRPCPASATLRVYDEAALGSASASLDKNLLDMPLTADGYCVSGFADGNYHVSYSYPGILSAWAYYPVLAANPALPAAAKQWFEKDPSGSFGITFRVSGGLYYPGPFSGNY